MAGTAFSWDYSAPDGVYKNGELSGKLLQHAALKFEFVPLTKKLDAFGKGKGEKITIPHIKSAAIPSNFGKLEEDTRIPVDTVSMGTRAISVFEWGRGMEFTNWMEQLSKFDPNSMVQKALEVQVKTCMDAAAADSFKDAKVVFIPTSLTGGTFDTDGTPSTSASHNLTKSHLGVIRDYMNTDLHVPFYSGNHYLGLFATKALRGLKDDRVIEAWNMYLRKGDIYFNNEVGRCENIRLLEIAHENALSNSIGTGDILGQGLVFGDEAVARAEIEFPHLRISPNFKGDFGRTKAVAWYGIVGFGTFWDTANDKEAKIVRIDSA